MRILILTTEYESFLKWHYLRSPHLATASYAEQFAARVETLFGGADFYSRNFRAMGHDAEEIFVNNIWLQTAWAREHGIAAPDAPAPERASSKADSELLMTLKRRLQPLRGILTPLARRLGYAIALSSVELRILRAQIEEMNPDVILNQIPDILTSTFLNSLRRPGRVIIAQHGNHPPANFDPSPYNFGIAIVPSIVESFRAAGLQTEYVHLAFDPSVLERLPPAPSKDIPVSFVGGLSSNHARRIELLETVAREMPVELYLSSFKGIPANSPLHSCVRGEVWGRDMYDILRRSKITLNSHVDAAGGVAANMRLYEATGVGTFLLTDNLRDLDKLFSPGTQVGTYDSPADCVAKIRYYLSHDAEREAIARAGQVQTLTYHTYRQRMQELIGLIAKYAL